MRQILVAVGTLAFLALPAGAHEHPSRVETRQGPHYRLEIAIYDEQPYVKRPVRFTVRALPSSPSLDCGAVTALGRPFVETRAIPTRRVRVHVDSDAPYRCAGEVWLPVQGLWDLEVNVATGTGGESVRLALTVAAPHAIPKWIAWGIGLSPLGVMAVFAWWQRGYLHRLRAAAA